MKKKVIARTAALLVSTLFSTFSFGVNFYPPRVTVSSAGDLRQIRSGLFNGDNLKDLAVIDHSSASIKVFQNVNGRDFTLASDLAPAGMPCDIAVGDLNGDGLSDIAAVPCDQSVLSLFFNDGAGSFQARVEYSLTGQSPYMVRIVELNGDGRADILVGGRETPDKRLEIFLNNGDGTLTERGASFQSQVMELLTSDFNGDGFQDVAAMELDSLTTQTEIEVMTNDGIGNLTSAGIYPHANGAEWSWAALELNGDSVEEIAALVPTSPRSVMLSMNDGLGHFSAGDTFAPASEPSAPSTLAAGDMNGDGTKDLVVLEAPGTGFTVLFKPKTGALRETGPRYFDAGEPGADGPDTAVLDDFDGDGALDVVTVYRPDAFGLWLNSGNGRFALPPAEYPTGTSPVAITLADFNGDGFQDLAVANRDSNDITIFFNAGDGSLSSAPGFQSRQESPNLTVPVGSQPVSLVSADFNGDGNFDLAIACRAENVIEILWGDGSGGFVDSGSRFPGGNDPRWIGQADVDADGRPDLAVLHAQGLILFRNSGGEGIFDAPQSFDAGLDPVFGEFGDLNGDDRPDLAVADFSGGTVAILLNDGGRGFAPPATIPAGRGSISLALADFDANGTEDVAVVNFSSRDISVFSGAGDGTYTKYMSFHAGTGPTSIVAGHYNCDGMPDLAVTDGEQNSLLLFLNDGSGSMAPPSELQTGDHPVAVVRGDLDRVGRDDLITANEESNTIGTFLNGDCGDPVLCEVDYDLPDQRLAVCAGTPVNLDAGAGFSIYRWSTGESTRKIALVPTKDMRVAVQVTDRQGCSGGRGFVVDVSLPPSVDVDADAWTKCAPPEQPTSFLLEVYGAAGAGGLPANLNLQWSVDKPGSISDARAPQVIISFPPEAPSGNYGVTLRVYGDEGSCPLLLERFVTVFDGESRVESPVGNTLKCFKSGDSIVFHHGEKAAPYYHLYRATEPKPASPGELADSRPSGALLTDVLTLPGSYFYRIKGADCQQVPGP